MQFKSKLRKIGNSFGVIIPKDVITGQVGEVITLEVITSNVITQKKEEVITQELTEPPKAKIELRNIPLWCEKKHKGRGVNATADVIN